MESAIPNFFLAGVPKAGTTSLYHYLGQHPEIYSSPIKEPHYFADEVRVNNFSDEFREMAAKAQQALREFLDGPMVGRCSAGPVENWDDYCRLFHQVSQQRAIGEASVCYLWSPSAIPNILARIPEARFILLLRNPIDRAFSQYRHMLSFAKQHVVFEKHFETAISGSSLLFSETYPYLHFGLYGDQLERLFALVSHEQVGIWFYEDYCSDPLTVLRGMFAFLGIDSMFTPDFSERFMEARIPRSYTVDRVLRGGRLARLGRRLLPDAAKMKIRSALFAPRHRLALSLRDRKLLGDYYRDDNKKLSQILGRDFSFWLDDRCQFGTFAPNGDRGR